jgi:hypothetical protein
VTIASVVIVSAAMIMFVPVVIETSSGNITSVISFEGRAIMCIIITVTIMSMPGGISIISIPGIIVFIDHNRRRDANPDMGIYVNLRISGITRKGGGRYQKKE